MDRAEIYSQLNEERICLKRRECTPRVMAATDLLLDQLIEIQHAEALEILEEEANGE
jgi:hypothetical protein